jgi:fermentation-respiration switch protein FrsA (DUF1100 family)
MYVIFIILGTLLFAIFAVGSYTFFAACRQTKRRNWLDPEELKGTDREKLYPYISHAHNWFSTHEVEDIYVQSRDGLQLYARWIPAENPRGTILLAHGYQSTPYIDFSLVLEVYHNLGMNMLIPDQRCHGKSEGKYITFGVKEWRDMTCWVDHHNKHLGNWPVILSGLSMGASTVLMASELPMPESVRGIVADCGFDSPSAIIKETARRRKIPGELAGWFVGLGARIFGGFRMDEASALDSVTRARLPILLVHGEEDEIVPFEMVHALKEACATPVEILTVPGAAHGISWYVDMPAYHEALIRFMEENMT